MTQNSIPLLRPSTAILILALFVAGGLYVFISRSTSRPAPDFPPPQAAAQVARLSFTNIVVRPSQATWAAGQLGSPDTALDWYRTRLSAPPSICRVPEIPPGPTPE